MLDSLPLWLHLIAATAWVGSQIMMFAVIVPSLRAADLRPRLHILAALTPRFAVLGLVSLGLLLLTGIDNISRYSPPEMFEYRYGYVLTTKLVLFGLLTVATLLHSFRVGPALLREQESAADTSSTADPRRLKQLRLASIGVSVFTFALSLGVLLCAALLRSTFSYVSV